jgi:hypothetical protein
MSRDEAKKYVEQWRRAGPELEKVRREELRNLTDEDVRAQIHALLELTKLYAGDRRSSGLVDQQRIFQKARR